MKSYLISAGIVGSVCVIALAVGIKTPADICATAVRQSTDLVRNETWLANAALSRIEHALILANDAHKDKLGVLIRELERLSQHERGLPTAWRVEVKSP